jgi:hypothetical protein
LNLKPGYLIKFIDESLDEVVGLILQGNTTDGFQILVGNRVLQTKEILQVKPITTGRG